MRQWFTLDNAGKIFPGQNSRKWSNAFRLKLSTDKPVNPKILEQALKNIMPRFPCFDVKLRYGLFWYYLEKNPKDAPPVMPDVNNICYRFKYSENDGFLFRVFYYENDISVEFFHAITDGQGCTMFACTLVAEYIRLRDNVDIPSGGFVLDIKQKATESELRDPFKYYCDSKVKAQRSSLNVYHRKTKKLPMHTARSITGFLEVDKVLELTRALGVTITEYMSAMLVYIHYRIQLREERKQRPISVQIPVNLRRTCDSDTLRNFSMTYQYRMDPNLGEWTFEEILSQLSLYLRYINNEKQLNSMMRANIALERNPIMRVMPLFIKRAGMYIAFAFTGEKSTTTLFSNLGRLAIPDELKQYITKAVLFTGPGILNGARVAAISHGKDLAITFVNCYVDRTIERDFFRELVSRGLHVRIESNME